MTTSGSLFIFVGTYRAEEDALADYEVVRELHRAGAIGSYDAVLVTKDEEGKVHATRVEMAARHAGWGGALGGALVGLLFPPAIVVTTIVGGAVGTLSGHLWRGMSRADVKELGETVDAGHVSLVVTGENKLEETLDTHGFAADHIVLKNVDLELEDLHRAVLDAAQENG